MDINDWIEQVINGTGGFKSWEQHECIAHSDRDKAIASFVLRSLGNIDCKGSESVLTRIYARRTVRLAESYKDPREPENKHTAPDARALINQVLQEIAETPPFE